MACSSLLDRTHAHSGDIQRRSVALKSTLQILRFRTRGRLQVMHAAGCRHADDGSQLGHCCYLGVGQVSGLAPKGIDEPPKLALHAAEVAICVGNVTGKSRKITGTQNPIGDERSPCHSGFPDLSGTFACRYTSAPDRHAYRTDRAHRLSPSGSRLTEWATAGLRIAGPRAKEEEQRHQDGDRDEKLGGPGLHAVELGRTVECVQ